MNKIFFCILLSMVSTSAAAQPQSEVGSSPTKANEAASARTTAANGPNITMLDLAYAESEAKAAQSELAAHPLSLGENPTHNAYFMKSNDAFKHLAGVKTAYYAENPPRPLTPQQVTGIQAKVRKTLLDEDSTTFKGIGYDEWAEPCGLVNAKNAFGGYVGYKRFTLRDNEVQMENSLFPERASCPSASAEQ